MIRNWLVIGAALLLVGTAACGGDDGDGKDGAGGRAGGKTGTGLKKACELLTDAEVEAALGTPVGPGEDSRGMACNWWGAEGGGSVTLNISYGEAQNFDATVDAAESILKDKNYTIDELSGVGDRAYLLVMTDSVGDLTVASVQVYATTGNNIVFVTMGSQVAGSTEALEDGAKSLVRKAIERF